MNNPTTDPRAAYDQYLRRGIQTPEVLNEAPSGVGYLLPKHLEAKLVNAMSESTLNGTGNRRDGRRRFDRGNRGDRSQRNFNNNNTEAKKEER